MKTLYLKLYYAPLYAEFEVYISPRPSFRKDIRIIIKPFISIEGPIKLYLLLKPASPTS